jgi:hypothetical protein
MQRSTHPHRDFFTSDPPNGTAALDPATAMEFVACDEEKGLPHRLDLLVFFVTDRALISGPLIRLLICKIAG